MTILNHFRSALARHWSAASVLNPRVHGGRNVLWGAAAFLAQAELTVSTTPPLFPAFDPAVHDYVAHCTDTPLHVSVTERGLISARVDGRRVAGRLNKEVALTSGQALTIEAWRPWRGTSTYSVRCLPADFPQFSVERPGNPQAEWYIATPNNTADQSPFPAGTSRQYAAIFDNRGVPVWWMKSQGTTTPVDAKLLPNGNVAWLHAAGSDSVGGGMEERRLDGSLALYLNYPLDHHDILLLEDGNYAAGRYLARAGVDLTSCGGPADATIVDNELYELSPDGDLLWEWDAYSHIPVEETTWPGVCATGRPDVYHYNAIEPDGDAYVVSFRHLNAVYKISRTTGEILWKLGGTRRPESLEVIGDPIVDAGGSLFGGQHDARRLPDGTWTVYDNRSQQPNAVPRALRFEIDEAARTATVIESVTDADVTRSFCCGSARKLNTGNWVMAWGANPNVTELTELGEHVFRINFTQNMFSYRASPVIPGVVTREALRAGMNAQYPRVQSDPATTPQ